MAVSIRPSGVEVVGGQNVHAKAVVTDGTASAYQWSTSTEDSGDTFTNLPGEQAADFTGILAKDVKRLRATINAIGENATVAVTHRAAEEQPVWYALFAKTSARVIGVAVVLLFLVGWCFPVAARRQAPWTRVRCSPGG